MSKFETEKEALESFQKHFLNVARTIMLQATEDDRKKEGPKHKEWNERYQKSLGKKLKEAGFSKTEILKIIQEIRTCFKKGRAIFLIIFLLWFILKSIWRIWKARVTSRRR